jgi:hypothetical protein
MTIGAKSSAAKGPRPAEARRQAGLRLERAGSGVGGSQELGVAPVTLNPAAPAPTSPDGGNPPETRLCGSRAGRGVPWPRR